MAKVSNKEINVAIQWWDSMSEAERMSVHKKSKYGHYPYEVFRKYTVLITHAYKALGGGNEEAKSN